MSYTNRNFTWDLNKLREFFLSYVLAPLRSLVGYYECGTAASQAAKTVTAAWYSTIREGGSMKIKFTNKNTAASGVTLKIGPAAAKPLYYGGAAVDATNTWDDGETVEVYYDGTSYYANNVAGGSGGDGAFDLSAKTGDSYETLSAALTAANSAIPPVKKKGGMSMKFILHTPASYRVVKTEGLDEQPSGYVLTDDPGIGSGTYNAGQLSAFGTLPTSVGSGNAVTYYMADFDGVTTYTKWVITLVQSSDNKYVQYRYMETTTTTFTNVANWQGVDDEPTAGSNNLVKSGWVYNATNIEEQSIKESGTVIPAYINKFNTWTSAGSSGKMIKIDNKNHESILIKAPQNNAAVMAFLTSTEYSLNQEPDNYATGSGRTEISKNSTVVFPIPGDAEYLYLYNHISYYPVEVKYVFSVKKKISVLEDKDEELDGKDEELQEHIDYLSSVQSVEFYQGRSIFLDTYNVGDVVSLTPNSNTPAFSYCVADVSISNEVFIKTHGGIAPRAFAFIDKDNKLISVADEKVTFYGILDVPSDARKLIVNDSKNGNCFCVIKRFSDNWEYNTIKPSWIGGNPIKNVSPFAFGIDESNSRQYIHTRIIKVLEGSRISISGLNENKELIILFYDEHWNRITFSTIHNFGDDTIYLEQIIPILAKYMVLQGRHKIEDVYYRDMGISVSMYMRIDNPYSFAPRSIDDGYQHLVMLVGVNNTKSNSYDPSNELQVETQYYVDHGVLCLPESYSVDGEPTRLIVFTHGHAVTYGPSAVRFDSNDIKPEYWLSEGFAIMDMDGRVTGTFSGNHDYEPAAVNAYDTAYQWVVAHYNIRIDGVFSTGRSQGGGMQFMLARTSTMPLLAIAPMVPVTSPLGYVLLPMTGSQRKELLAAYGIPSSVLDNVSWTSASSAYHQLTTDERTVIVENQRYIAPYAPGYCINRPFTDDELLNWSRAWSTGTESYLLSLTNSIAESINIASYRSIPIRMYTCVGDPVVKYKTVVWLHDILSRAGYNVQIHVFPATTVPSQTDHRFEINEENLVTYTNSKGITLENVPKVYIETLAFWRKFENQDFNCN